ncbi:PREDICTED: sodium channel protein 60E-like, partial [Rhagoletis zephyria]|uniref:sodium channel protein 60E-like n=1 Tax=Rhagoletis zephyria TaxID=28612 RepID=UPI0008116217
GSIFVEAPRANRRRSIYNFFLRHQDAVDDSLTSPSVHRKSNYLKIKKIRHNTHTHAQSTKKKNSISSTTTATERQTQPQSQSQLQQLPTQIAPTPTRKRATSFIRKKPPLERGLSAQSALRVNKNAFVSEGPTPEVIVTKPSPEQQSGPLGLRPDNSTLVHVLVHRESEEYKEEEDDEGGGGGGGDGGGGGVSPVGAIDKFKPPQIHISPGSEDIRFDDLITMQQPIVQIMVDSPKDPPRGDFSDENQNASAQVYDYTAPTNEESPTSDSHIEEEISPATAIDLNEPIDVNIQGDTSKVFYDYNPQDANEIIVLETLTEESPKSEDLPLPQAALPALQQSTITTPPAYAPTAAVTPTTPVAATPPDAPESGATSGGAGTSDESDKAIR